MIQFDNVLITPVALNQNTFAPQFQLTQDTMNAIKRLIILFVTLLFFVPLTAQETTHANEDNPRSIYIALKTNTIYDIALIPNIGIELYTGKGWAVGGNFISAWWKNQKRNRFWRIYGMEVELRKYLGSKAAGKPLTGHHIGIYTQFVTYDFEIGGKGYIGGKPGGSIFDKMNYGAGVEYGYSLPVAKRLNMDFAIGLGYLGGQRWEYKPQDSHYVWQRTSTKHWVGPTRAEISLVWLIGRGNYNYKKEATHEK